MSKVEDLTKQSLGGEKFTEGDDLHEFGKEISLEQAKFELEEIKESLGDFIKQVIKEKPDVIVFLDKGARMFGTPIKKYLEYLGVKDIPKIQFFNDDFLKEVYVSGKLTKELLEEELGFVRGKKTFFFDEVFVDGVGAAVLKQAKDGLDWENLYYFALGYYVQELELGPNGEMNEIQYAMLEKIHKDKNFKIYPNEHSDLFSADESCRYVTETEVNGRRRTIHRTKAAMLRGEKDYYKDINIKDFKVVAELKKMIFKTLKTLNINPNS